MALVHAFLAASIGLKDSLVVIAMFLLSEQKKEGLGRLLQDNLAIWSSSGLDASFTRVHPSSASRIW